MTKLNTFIATCFILTLVTTDLVAESSQCSQCHAAEVQAWSKSHHAKAMAVATSENVLGDFNNTEFEHHDLKLQFVQQDSQFKVMLEEEGSKSE